MSKQEFLSNVRVASNLFAHPRVFADSHQLDPADLAETIAGAAIWLTPKSVRGFAVEDFAELGVPRQGELAAAVRDFARVAGELSPTEPASEEQLSRGIDAFTRVVAILDAYLPSGEETQAIRQALQELQQIPGVVNWSYELGSDDDGAAAIWVTVYVDEAKVPRSSLGRFSLNLTDQIRRQLKEAGIHRWPYLRLWTPAEYRSL